MNFGTKSRLTPVAAGPMPGQGMTVDVALRSHAFRVSEYISKVFPAALRRRYDPSDLFQATMFEAFRRSASFRYVSDEATLSWLLVLARGQVGMALRNERRAKRGGGWKAVEIDHETDRLLGDYAVHRRTPSRSAAGHEAMAMVERALTGMPTHFAKAVRLRYLDGLPMSGVAAALNLSEPAAAALCFRGVRLLRRKLGTLSRYVA